MTETERKPPTIEQIVIALADMPKADTRGFFRCLNLFWSKNKVATTAAVYAAYLTEQGEEDADEVVDTLIDPDRKGQKDDRYDYTEGNEDPINRRTQER